MGVSYWLPTVAKALLLSQGRGLPSLKAGDRCLCEKCPPFVEMIPSSFLLLVRSTAVSGTGTRAPPSGLPDSIFNEVSFIYFHSHNL